MTLPPITDSMIHHGKQGAYFTPSDAEIFMRAYEKVKDLVKKEDYSANQREKVW